MKKIITTLLFTILFTGVSLARIENDTTFSKQIVQSTIHDALQLYHAKHGLTFYFRPTGADDKGYGNYEVYDLYYQKHLGKLTSFANEFGVAEDQAQEKLVVLMKSLITKYNGQQQYIMGRLSASGKDNREAYCKAICERILKRNSGRTDTNWQEAYAYNNYMPNEAAKKFSASVPDTTFIKSLDIALLATDDLGGNALPSAETVAKALAAFLLERANEEINAAVFRRLKEALEKVTELKVLFPETKELLANIESYNFEAALKVLRVRLESDLQNLPGNIPKLADYKPYKTLLDSVPELTFFFAASELANGLKNTDNPGKIVQNIYSSSYVKDKHRLPANMLKLTGFISYSLRDVMEAEKNSNDRDWISPGLLAYKLKDLEEISNYYFGLLVASSPNIMFKVGTDKFKFDSLLNKAQPHVSKVSGMLNNTLESIQTIEKELAAIRALSHDGKVILEKYDHYETILKEVLNMGESFMDFSDFPQQAILKRKIAELDSVYLPMSRQAVSIVANLEQKNYSEAVYSAGRLLESIIERLKARAAAQEEQEKKVKDKTGEEVAASNQKKLQVRLEKLEPYFLYAQLLASIALAKTPEDMKKTIDAVALPTGSSSIKKDDCFNIALNGYIGYFYRDMGKGEFSEGFTQSHGITAPVGFTFSTGFRKGGSLSFFAGVLDVGAIVQYDLDTDAGGNTTAEPVIEWGNIISPSAQLVYGLPFYLPLSIGMGAQWLPSDDHYALTSRFNAFIAFDIPILNLSSVKKPKR